MAGTGKGVGVAAPRRRRGVKKPSRIRRIPRSRGRLDVRAHVPNRRSRIRAVRHRRGADRVHAPGRQKRRRSRGRQSRLAAVVKALPLTAMKLLSPALIAGMTHKDWQSKLDRFTSWVISPIACRNRSCAPFELFPVSSTRSSTPIPRCRRCQDILPTICACVKNAEVLGMLDLILDAIRTPQKATEDCLDKLMETTPCQLDGRRRRRALR